MSRAPTVRAESERGVALLLALLLTIVVVGITTTGSLIIQSHRARTKNSFATNNQAVEVARSGLIEALSWVRRQTSQPVLTFEPQLDTGASPPVLDTIDPDIGIVREFKITDEVWARYEVWKQWDADPDSVRRAWRATVQCSDVSMARGARSLGSVWQIRSVGYVYARIDPNVAFNESPNYILGSDIIETEVRRLSLNIPGQAAVNIGDGNSSHINTNGRIQGGGAAGIYYPASSGTPTTGPASALRVTGSPALATATNYDDSYEAVFGLPYDQLRSMAHLVVTDPAEFPNPVPTNSLVIVEVQTTMGWDATLPLMGTGIVIVAGNARLDAGSNSNFSGLLYVDGNLTVRAPSEVRGSVVTTGNMTVQGVPDYATIMFDDDVLNALRVSFGNYNRSNGLLRLRSKV